MHCNAKTEYACLAMVELAAVHDSGEPLRLKAICEKHAIPSRFLVQIMLQLKAAGLVRSTRGSAGGYQLEHPPEEVTLYDVVSVIEGAKPVEAEESVGEPTAAAAIAQLWQHVAQSRREVLQAVTLADLARRVEAEAAAMFYI